SLSFDAGEGTAGPAPQYAAITSTGNTPYTWTTAATSTGNWLRVSQASGSGGATLRVSVSPGTLRAGTASGTITITAANLAASPKTIAVTMRVISDPVLAIGVRSLAFATTGGQDSPAQSVNIANNGGGTLDWTATVASTGNWLRVSAARGTGNSTIQVSAA